MHRLASAAHAAVLPGVVLRQGCAYSVLGSTSLLTILLAGPSQAGDWCGVIGLPDLGVEAAAARGVVLERLVLIPAPGDQWLAVTAALVDALAVIVVRPPRSVGAADAARLAARLRQRGGILLVAGAWPRCEAEFRLVDRRWSGLGAGHGSLAESDDTMLTTDRSGRMLRGRISLATRAPDRPAHAASAGSATAYAASALPVPARSREARAVG